MSKPTSTRFCNHQIHMSFRNLKLTHWQSQNRILQWKIRYNLFGVQGKDQHRDHGWREPGRGNQFARQRSHAVKGSYRHNLQLPGHLFWCMRMIQLTLFEFGRESAHAISRSTRNRRTALQLKQTKLSLFSGCWFCTSIPQVGDLSYVPSRKL